MGAKEVKPGQKKGPEGGQGLPRGDLFSGLLVILERNPWTVVTHQAVLLLVSEKDAKLTSDYVNRKLHQLQDVAIAVL